MREARCGFPGPSPAGIRSGGGGWAGGNGRVCGGETGSRRALAGTAVRGHLSRGPCAPPPTARRAHGRPRAAVPRPLPGLAPLRRAGYRLFHAALPGCPSPSPSLPGGPCLFANTSLRGLEPAPWEGRVGCSVSQPSCSAAPPWALRWEEAEVCDRCTNPHTLVWGLWVGRGPRGVRGGQWRWALRGHGSGLSEHPRPRVSVFHPKAHSRAWSRGRVPSPRGEGPGLSSPKALPRAGGPCPVSRPSGNSPSPSLNARGVPAGAAAHAGRQAATMAVAVGVRPACALQRHSGGPRHRRQSRMAPGPWWHSGGDPSAVTFLAHRHVVTTRRSCPLGPAGPRWPVPPSAQSPSTRGRSAWGRGAAGARPPPLLLPLGLVCHGRRALTGAACPPLSAVKGLRCDLASLVVLEPEDEALDRVPLLPPAPVPAVGWSGPPTGSGPRRRGRWSLAISDGALWRQRGGVAVCVPSLLGAHTRSTEAVAGTGLRGGPDARGPGPRRPGVCGASCQRVRAGPPQPPPMGAGRLQCQD